MTTDVDVIQGAIKLQQLPDRQCFTNWQDFLRRLPDLLSVEIPTDVTNVTVGNTYPSDSEQDHLWVKTDSSGNFVGLFLFVTGAWRQIYPLPDQLFLIIGDSRSVPDGYTLASDDPRITALMLANLQKIWTIGGTTPTWYSVYHATFTGW